jgi:glutaredoxin-like protein
MAIFNEEIQKQLTDMLGNFPRRVRIAFFGSDNGCRSCKDTLQFMTEFAALHENLELDVYDMEVDRDYAAELGVDKVPSMVVLDSDSQDFGMRFYGIPAGYEIHSLISAVREMGGIPADLPVEIEERISKLDKDVHIRVFVTPTCPYCPGAVITGHRLAMLNKRIKADMIEANTFPEESAKYGVRGVPKIVINDTHEFVGSQPITKFLETIDGI